MPEGSPESAFRYVFSNDFGELIDKVNGSLFLNTYQAGKLMVVRTINGRVSTLLRSFEMPMGLAVDPHRLAIGTRRQIWFFRNAPDIAAQLEPRETFDSCYVPRASHVTGDFRAHEIAWVGDELWIVNTRFSCLCTVDPDYSFVPRWQPKWIDKLVAEDRCHLNGMAVADGRVKYLTAHGEGNERQGWRENKRDGGVIIDFDSREVISRGLAMPHSPRVYANRLFVLDSGRGELQVVDPDSGKRDTVCRLPGFTRGLTFYDRFAFVGLSMIREKKEFGGLPLEKWIDRPRCGVFAVNLETGQPAGFLEFEAGAEELFDVQVLRGLNRPQVIGFQKRTLDGIFIVPPEVTQAAVEPDPADAQPIAGEVESDTGDE